MGTTVIPSSVSRAEVVPRGEAPADVDESPEVGVDGLNKGNLMLLLWLLLLQDRHGKWLCCQGAPRHLNKNSRLLSELNQNNSISFCLIL